MHLKLIVRRFKVVVFYVWGETVVLFERLVEIHSNPPIVYYGFNLNDKWGEEKVKIIRGVKSNALK